MLKSFLSYCKENEINDRKVPSSLNALSSLAFKNGFKDKLAGKKSERKRVYSACKVWKPGSKYREGTEDS
jgi:hypothetical protein